MIGHQRGHPALEGIERRLGQLRGAEGRVARDADRAPQGEHLVVDERQLVDSTQASAVPIGGWTWTTAPASKRR